MLRLSTFSNIIGLRLLLPPTISYTHTPFRANLDRGWGLVEEIIFQKNGIRMNLAFVYLTGLLQVLNRFKTCGSGHSG